MRCGKIICLMFVFLFLFFFRSIHRNPIRHYLVTAFSSLVFCNVRSRSTYDAGVFCFFFFFFHPSRGVIVTGARREQIARIPRIPVGATTPVLAYDNLL